MATRMLWQDELRNSIKKPSDLVKLGIVSEDDLPKIEEIHGIFPFSITPYYSNLINWGNRQDPLLRIVAPLLDEMDRVDSLDAKVLIMSYSLAEKR